MRSFDILIVYPNALFTYKFFRVLLEDTVVTGICWFLMRCFIIWLDNVYPYSKGIAKRIALQAPMALLINCGSLLIINEGVQYFLYHQPTPKIVYTHHIWIYAIWTLIQNAIYITIYLISWFKLIEKEKATKTNKETQQKLSIKLGNKNIYLDIHNISFCTVTDNFTTLHTRENDTFIIERSLDQLATILPTEDFFRVNRQFIIHKDLVKAIQKQENGKIKLLFKDSPQLPTSISISRIKAPFFKKWLQQQIA
jgi:hypothetical protein